MKLKGVCLCVEIYSVYADRLQAAAISNVSPITGLTYQLAYYAEPGKYEMLSETLPLETGKPFFAPKKANTVFVKGTVTFPAEIRQDEEYEDCLLSRFHNLGGTIYVDGEPYSGIDEFRDRIYLRKEWAGQTKEFLIEGLKRLEYRGYDSSGICVLEEKTLKTLKAKGKLSNLIDITSKETLNYKIFDITFFFILNSLS